MELENKPIGYKIRLIHNQIHKQMEAKRVRNEAGEDLTQMQRWTMQLLSEKRGEVICQKDMEEVFHISRATASNILQLMEKRQLIDRIPVPYDARLKQLVLTPKAERLMKQAREDIREIEELLIKGMTKEQVEIFQQCLNQTILNLVCEEEENHK